MDGQIRKCNFIQFHSHYDQNWRSFGLSSWNPEFLGKIELNRFISANQIGINWASLVHPPIL